MGPVFNTRHLGDLLLSMGKRFRDPGMYPWQSTFSHLLQYLWQQKAKRIDPKSPFESFWIEARRRGGMWEISGKENRQAFSQVARSILSQNLRPGRRPQRNFTSSTYPTLQFFDGRDANRPWLQELPDPLTQITWGNWLEIHPETAKRLEVRKGDLLLLESPSGSIEIPAYPYPGIDPGTVAIPLGQGHTAFGRYANQRMANPLLLLSSHPRSFFRRNRRACSPCYTQENGKEISLRPHGRKPVPAWTGDCPVDLVRTVSKVKPGRTKASASTPPSRRGFS